MICISNLPDAVLSRFEVKDRSSTRACPCSTTLRIEFCVCGLEWKFVESYVKQVELVCDCEFVVSKTAKMKIVASLVKDVVPNYLSNLPIPDSVGGWFKLGIKDWLALIPPTAVVAGITYTLYRAYCPKCRSEGDCRVNRKILKNNPKVVDTIDVEDITEKAVFCRCWKSKNWPYCDGSHGAHNKETGDNVGPLIVKK